MGAALVLGEPPSCAKLGTCRLEPVGGGALDDKPVDEPDDDEDGDEPRPPVRRYIKPRRPPEGDSYDYDDDPDVEADPDPDVEADPAAPGDDAYVTLDPDAEEAADSPNQADPRGAVKRWGVFVAGPTMMRVTDDDAERLFLSNLDYWMGFEKGKDGKHRRHASERKIHRPRGGGPPSYITTARQLGQRLGKDRRAVHRLVERLRKKGFIVVEPRGRDGYAVRLNWPVLDPIIAAAEAAEDRRRKGRNGSDD